MMLVGGVVLRATGAVAGILVARLLGPEDRGIYAIFFVSGTAFGTVGTAGLDIWATRMAARGDAPDRVEGVLRRHELVAGLVLSGLALGLAALAAATRWLPIAPVFAAAMLAVAVLHAAIRQGVLLGLGLMRGHVSAGAAGAFAYLGVVVALGVIGSHSVTFVLLGAGLGIATQGVLSRHLARRTRTTVVPSAEGAVDVSYRDALRFGVPSSIGVAVSFAAYRIDVLIVAAFLSPGQVGLYAVAVALGEILVLLPNVMSHVVLSHAASGRTSVDTASVVRLSTLVSIPVAVALTVGAPLIVSLLYGPDYEGAAEAVPWVAVAALSLGVWKILMVDLLGRGHSRYRATTATTSLVAMVVADLLLVPRFGIAGAGAGSLIGYTAGLGHLVIQWRRLTHLRVRDLVGFHIGDMQHVIGRR